MNGSTVRKLMKSVYSLCSNDLLAQPGTSRILYNYTVERKYNNSRWSMHHIAANTSHLSPMTIRWNAHSSLVNTDFCRYLSTTLPHNGQTALKPKSPGRGEKKQPKDTEKAFVDDDQPEKKTKSTTEDANVVAPTKTDAPKVEKLTLTARFKKMYKEYWYVLLPVHVITSTVWLGGFYYLSSSGVDIPAVLELMNFNETIVNKLRDSSMGHWAIAYLCYKIATPLRYTVTVGGTTLSIKYLSELGYIRPVPSTEKLKKMYDDQKAKFKH